MYNFTPLKKSLLLQYFSPFPPALSSFPGHRIQSRSWQEPAWSGRFSQYCAFSLYPPCRLTLSGKASSFQEGLGFPWVPRLIKSCINEYYSRATPSRAWKRRDLTAVYTYNGRLPCNPRSSSENALGWQTRRLQRWTLNHSPPPLFRKIWPPQKNMRWTLAKIISYNLVPELYMVLQHRSDF